MTSVLPSIWTSSFLFCFFFYYVPISFRVYFDHASSKRPVFSTFNIICLFDMCVPFSDNYLHEPLLRLLLQYARNYSKGYWMEIIMDPDVVLWIFYSVVYIFSFVFYFIFLSFLFFWGVGWGVSFHFLSNIVNICFRVCNMRSVRFSSLCWTWKLFMDILSSRQI